MASESSGRRSVRLPPDQQKELDKDGRIRRFFCDTLRLRVLGYIAAQPASCLFILSLFLIAACMPPIGWYIKTHKNLPDLYTMKIWNSYLGRLSETSFCIVKTPPTSSDYCNGDKSIGGTSYDMVSVSLGFLVEKDALEEDNVHLVAQLSGKELKTQIRLHNSTERVDSNITIHIHLKGNKKDCSNDTCQVFGCVSITAPLDAQPVRMPHIPEDFTFGTAVMNINHGTLSEKNPTLCNCSASMWTHEEKLQGLYRSGSEECKDEHKSVKPVGETFRHHGLIDILLTDDDREAASFRVMMAALLVAVVGIAFAIGIACTDRPAQPKNSTE